MIFCSAGSGMLADGAVSCDLGGFDLDWFEAGWVCGLLVVDMVW